LQVWDIVNETLMDHPFHLHGFFFQVLEVNGKPPAWRSWRRQRSKRRLAAVVASAILVTAFSEWSAT
jgi:FtsP/CotA-like multicopper oxidase with cupredoxin domain